MSYAELLAKLNARTVDPAVAGSTAATGGDTQGMAHFVAAAMSGIPRNAACLVRVKYGVCDAIDRRHLEVHVLVGAHAVAKAARWGNRSLTLLPSVARTALEEFIDDPVCACCRNVSDDRAVCRVCRGTGRYRWPARKRIHGCGMHYDTWRKSRWERRYRDLLGMLALWEAGAFMKMADHLRELDGLDA